MRALNGGGLANEGESPSIVMWTGARNLSDLSQILEAGLSSVKRNIIIMPEKVDDQSDQGCS